ncbi:hypothetical protein ACFLT0_00570 [Chloroflexota bacterium]
MPTGGGVKVIGPNTIGLVNPGFHLNATFNPFFNSIKAGNAACLSQSGGMGGFISYTLCEHNVGISKLMGLGNRCNLDFHEVLLYLAQDEQTNVIVMYIEGLEQPKQLLTTAREVVRHKPIVVYKGGRGEDSDRATLSHTGALAGKYEFYRAAFTQAGMLTTNNITELADMAKALAFQPPASGNRIAIISVQAGPGIIIADKCREQGLRLAEILPATKRKLRQLISPLNPVDNPIDLAWQYDKVDTCRAMLEVILNDDSVDALIVAGVGYTPELTEAVIDVGKHYTKPLVACLSPFGGFNCEQRNALEESRIPTYPLPERAVTGLAGLVRYGEVLAALG